MPEIELPLAAYRVLDTKARIIVLIGGRSSSKSETFGRIMLMKGQSEKADILCGREYQTSIDESVHKLLTGLVTKLEMTGVRSTKQLIDFEDGGGIRYKGFARTPSAVKSAQDFKYSWIEEAQDLSEDSIELLLPTIRAPGSKLFFTANPGASTDPFSVRFIMPFLEMVRKQGYYEDAMHLIIMMNWRNNPWHGELESQRLYDFKHMSRAKYDHIWEGAFNDTVEDAIILAEWFDAAIDAHKKLGFKPTGARIVSHDPSDKGPDPKSLCLRQGSVILDVQRKTGLDVNDGCDWATSYAIEYDADMFVWDCDGMGVGLRRQVDDALKGKKIEWREYKGSSGVDRPNEVYEPITNEDKRKARTNKQTFKNKRAQDCWDLRDRYYKTFRAVQHGEYIDPDELISVSSEIEDMEQLRSETCRIPKKYNGSGLIQIMDKPQMATKYGIKSPNMFDSTFMSLEAPTSTAPPPRVPVIPNVHRNF